MHQTNLHFHKKLGASAAYEAVGGGQGELGKTGEL